MTLKRVLQCTLILLVFVTSGCDLISDKPSAPPKPASSVSPLPENKISFRHAAELVRNAHTLLTLPGKTGLVGPVKNAIADARDELGKNEADVRQRCGGRPEIKDKAVAVWQKLGLISISLDKVSQKKIEELGEQPTKTLISDLSEQANKLTELDEAIAAASDSRPGLQSGTPHGTSNDDQNNDSGVWGLLVLLTKVLAALLVLVLLASAVNYLWKRFWRTLESHIARVVKGQLIAAFEAQPDYTAKLSALASTQTDTNSKLGELDNEVRSLARLIRDSLARRSDRNPSYSSYQSYTEDVSPKDEPEFPVSAVDYLGRMNRFANVVRPDFQNGILVNAPDGDGELVLIRDSRDDTQPLFVVPRATQFHTKQDFYTYYQKYYDCARPSAGDVWIIGPAVVEKVTGGWELREKGMLEIR